MSFLEFQKQVIFQFAPLSEGGRCDFNICVVLLFYVEELPLHVHLPAPIARSALEIEMVGHQVYLMWFGWAFVFLFSKVYLTRKELNISEDQWENQVDDSFRKTVLEHEVKRPYVVPLLLALKQFSFYTHLITQIYESKEKLEKYREAMMPPSMKKKHIRMKKKM
jgi:hypothetical protein